MDQEEKELLDISYQIQELITRKQNKDILRNKLNKYVELVSYIENALDTEIEDTKVSIRDTQKLGLTFNSIELEGFLRALLLFKETIDDMKDSILTQDE